MKYLLSLLSLVLFTEYLIAQNNVGIGTPNPNANALLHLENNGNSLGLILPRQPIGTFVGLGAADLGLTVYDDSLNKIMFWDGGQWNEVSSFGPQAANTIYAGPGLGPNAQPTFRSLVVNDMPNLPASQIASGILPIARGGTNSNATPTNGGIAYGTGSSIAFTSSGGAGRVLMANGAAAPSWVNPESFGWSLTGNSSTVPTNNFLGTTDATDFVIRTDNTERVRISDSGDVGIGTNNPAFQLTLGGTGAVMGFENTATIRVKNSSGVYENFLWPRWSDDITYLNYGTGGMRIRNNGSTSIIEMTNGGLVSFPRTTDASGTVGSGVLEIAGSLRLDGNEIITNTGDPLFLQQGNGGDLVVDANTLVVDATNNRVGIGTNTPFSALHVNNGDIYYNNNAIISASTSSNIATSTNIDHIYHDDGPNSWNFVSDATYKAAGNSLLNAGRLNLEAGTGGQNALNVSSSSTWGTAINISNSSISGSGSQYDFVLAGSSHPNIPANNFAFVEHDSGVEVYRFNVLNSYFDPDGVGALFGIGTDSPSQTLSVAGSAGKTGGGLWAGFSDERLKHSIKSLDDGLDKVLQIQPKRFKYNEKSGYSDTNTEYYGVIAQEIQQVLPYTVQVDTVHKAPDGSGYLIYDGSALPYVLINAIKELNKKIEAQQAEINALKSDK